MAERAAIRSGEERRRDGRGRRDGFQAAAFAGFPGGGEHVLEEDDAEELEAVAEAGNAGFFGLQAEVESGEGLFGELQRSLDRRFGLAENHKVVGIADQAEAGGEEAVVEGIQAKVGEQGADDGALRDADGGAGEVEAVPDGVVEPEAAEAEGGFVGDERGEAGEEDGPVDVIEEGVDVGVEEPGVALAKAGVDALDSEADAAAPAVGEAAIVEFGFE